MGWTVKPGRKFKRKTLKQWAAFVRKGGGFRARTYAADLALHVFEDEVILRKIAQSKRGAVTATELSGLYPDVFSADHLPRAMKRMAGSGRLVRAGRGWKRSVSYRLPVAPSEEVGRGDVEAA